VGLTVLDAGVVIAILDASDAHHTAAVSAVAEARERSETLVLPASAYAECLVAPHRRGPDAVATVDAFVDALPARIEPATREIAATAAELRARHAGGLRLPDALVVATALTLGADRLITTDARWPPLSVQVEVLAPGASTRR
jgi:predicted nucleic acid-binding protein